MTSMAQAMDLLNQRRVDGIVHLQSDFSSSLFRRNLSPVQMIVNGIDANRARLIQGYARGVLQKWTVTASGPGRTGGRSCREGLPADMVQRGGRQP